MTWYATGTVTTAASTALVGAGTAWIANAAPGMGVRLADRLVYEIASVNSDTSITLATAYAGTTGAGQTYSLMPTQDYIRSLASQVASLIGTYSGIANTVGVGQFGYGTVASPGITFAGNTNTGLYRYAANTLGFTTNGVLAAVIDGSGNVGIGTASPGYKLDLVGNFRSTVADAVSSDFVAASARLRFRPYVDATYGSMLEATNVAGSVNTQLSMNGGTLKFYIAGVEKTQIDSSGNQINTPSNTPPTLTVNGQMNLTPTSNTNMRISYRGSDGVTRVANITLA